MAGIGFAPCRTTVAEDIRNTSKAGRDTRAALAGWPDLADLGEAACAERHSGQCRRAGADLDSTSSL